MRRQIIKGTTGTRPFVRSEDGTKVLRVGGVIQSVAVDETYTGDVWDAMLPAHPPTNALILGLGGGTIAILLTERYGAVPIVGVEFDPAVAWLAQHEFGLNALLNVQVVIEDAFAYVQRCEATYDAICVDLYVAGKMAHGVLGTAFLRNLSRILTPNGVLAINLWRSPYLADQLRRLERILSIQSSTEVDDNIIVFCTHK